MDIRRRANAPASHPASADDPERAVAADRLVRGQGEPREGEDLGTVRHEAVIRVALDPEQPLQRVVVERQVPLPGQFGQLVAKARQTGGASVEPADSGSETARTCVGR